MKTISRIAYSNDKKNKTRSILIMMSIFFQVMPFTSYSSNESAFNKKSYTFMIKIP